MIRKLLATTAMAGLFATGAFAQETTAPEPAAPSADAAAPAGAMGASADVGAAANSGSYLQSLSLQQHLVSEMDDAEIYAGNQPDAQSLGEIQNYLVEKDGKIAAAIVEATINDESRTVAVPFDQIQWSMGENNEPRATMTNADALNSAPIFMERQAAATTDPSMAAGSGTATGAGGTAMAPAAGDTAATGAAPAAGGTMAPAAGSSDMAANSGAAAPAGETMMQGPDQYLTADLVGQDIRSGAGDDAETIGEVSDLVVSDNGMVDAAVVGVGGFLGIGQKNVAVPFGEFQVTPQDGGDPVFVLAASKEQLEQAPTFEGREQNVAANTSSGTGGMANDMAATGAAAGAATGAAVGGAADTASNMASNAGSAMEGAATSAGNAVTGATETAQNQSGMATTGTDNSTTASTGGSSRENMMPVDSSAQLTADELMGTTVYGPNDQSLGKVGDVAMTADGRVDAVIVDVGGFLGIGAKPVAVGLDNVQLMRDQGDSLYIYTQFSQDQLENAPAYDQSSYAENRDTMRLQGETAPAAGGTAPAAGGASTTTN
ncbi:PRC-barrel domain-containing protein [Antarcticirhabdus aurantiaca]|uniref:PRC-barrel domain-containing protein n=1 Tax=Antarcticirhabdus aurantiaca TaxID=2606717 RepID=A0ACD4NT18_9HYPH|nr:PRC-barrel domain-containing protein [Antarcticirhabdus aurantiaca]WAJ30001.1 PRC-barrel domain-containing protein [Jeongeuplla avenae]